MPGATPATLAATGVTCTITGGTFYSGTTTVTGCTDQTRTAAFTLGSVYRYANYEHRHRPDRRDCRLGHGRSVSFVAGVVGATGPTGPTGGDRPDRSYGRYRRCVNRCRSHGCNGSDGCNRSDGCDRREFIHNHNRGVHPACRGRDGYFQRRELDLDRRRVKRCSSEAAITPSLLSPRHQRSFSTTSGTRVTPRRERRSRLIRRLPPTA